VKSVTKTIHAIYKNGVLKPLGPMEGISDNTEVEITISAVKGAVHPLMRFAGIMSAEEADSMMKIVEDEFERVNPDEWKD
jgi:predicted DNA-binding antitoxin AbrB/MazE fold protein